MVLRFRRVPYLGPVRSIKGQILPLSLMEGAYLVTGASRGIGKSIALSIARNGNPVIALARQSNELESVKSELLELQPDSIIIACDLGVSSHITDAVAKVSSKFSHLSGIVHNAGTIHPIENMMDANIENWSNSIQVNLIGVQELTNQLKSSIGGQSHTRITAISSGAAKRSIHGWSAYCVSKAGLDMWSMCMAEEGAGRNISSLSIAPGIVDTGMQEDIRSAKPESFPSLESFVGYYKNGDLTNPDDVAEKLLPFCLGIKGENGNRLDVRNL